MDWNKTKVSCLVLFAVFAASCAKESAKPGETAGVHISFAEAQPRTTLDADRTKLVWCEGDAVSILNTGNTTNEKLNYSSEGAVATSIPAGEEYVYAVYPYDPAIEGGAKAATISIPAAQSQTRPGEMNGTAYPMVSASAIIDNSTTLAFKPVASCFALNIYNTLLEGVEKLYTVKVTPTANSKFAGSITADLTGEVNFTEGDSSEPLTLSLINSLTLEDGKPAVAKTYGGQLYVTLARQSYTKVQFEITTDKHVYTIQSNDTAIDLTSCDIKVLGIDLGKGKIYLEGGSSHEGIEPEGTDITEIGSFLENPVPVERILDNLDHDIIPDFSRVGYRYGDKPIPDYANVVNVAAPTGGDDTELIQGAIDNAPKNSVVLLAAGTYKISGIIFLDRDGIILRGASGGTTILSTTKNKQPVINFGATVDNRAVTTSTETINYPHGEVAEITTVAVNVPSVVYSSQTTITEDYVPVGRLYVKVSRPELFAVGDRVAVYRPGTVEWIHDIKMDQIYDKDGRTKQWKTKDYCIYWDRVVTDVVGDRVYLDNPVVMALDKNYGGGLLVKRSRERITESGIENLTLDCEYDPNINGAPYYNLCDESHAWWGVRIRCAEHCWVKGVTTKHIGYGSVEIGVGSKNVTVDDCHSLSPISIVDGSRRYAFQFVNGTASIYKNCTCEGDRHQFVTTSQHPGPDVFYNCTATQSLSETGPHQRWATGVLYDNVKIPAEQNPISAYIEVEDGAEWGTGHGWTGANFVFWNVEAGSIVCQSPWKSARNYAVGCVGIKAPATRNYFDDLGSRPDGEWFPARAIGSTGGSHIMLPYTNPDKPEWFPLLEGSSFTHPESLYECQLEDRHNRGIFFDRIK